MIHVGAFLSCILIAAIGSAAGSPAPQAPFLFLADADIVGPSIPDDTCSSTGYGTFRVQSPTILNFPDFYNSAGSVLKQTIFSENNGPVSVDSDILVDPVCYTNSSCGVLFVNPLSIDFSNVKKFNENCGNVVYITLGQPLYLLSHSGIGCQYFPDSGYGSGQCSVNYRGFSDTGVNITVALVNFVDDDSCDGFYLSVLTYNTQTDTSKTVFCTTSVTTVHSPVSRGRFDFKGISTTGRPKYGFIIKLVDA